MRSLNRTSSRSESSASEWPSEFRQRLRDLPAELEPPYDWQEFRRRERARMGQRRSPVRWEHAAVAAAITLLIAGLAFWGRADRQPAATAHVRTGVSAPARSESPRSEVDAASSQALAEQMPAINADANAAVAAAVHAAVAAQLAALERSHESQQWLNSQPAEPALVRVGPRLAVANLEDRIAWVDDVLTEARFSSASDSRVQALQQERDRLINTLAQVRYAEALVAHAP
jgi:hypothetical protein